MSDSSGEDTDSSSEEVVVTGKKSIYSRDKIRYAVDYAELSKYGGSTQKFKVYGWYDVNYLNELKNKARKGKLKKLLDVRHFSAEVDPVMKVLMHTKGKTPTELQLEFSNFFKVFPVDENIYNIIMAELYPTRVSFWKRSTISSDKSNTITNMSLGYYLADNCIIQLIGVIGPVYFNLKLLLAAFLYK